MCFGGQIISFDITVILCFQTLIMCKEICTVQLEVKYEIRFERMTSGVAKVISLEFLLILLVFKNLHSKLVKIVPKEFFLKMYCQINVKMNVCKYSII